jgi:hypothetical protein
MAAIAQWKSLGLSLPTKESSPITPVRGNMVGMLDSNLVVSRELLLSDYGGFHIDVPTSDEKYVKM